MTRIAADELGGGKSRVEEELQTQINLRRRGLVPLQDGRLCRAPPFADAFSGIGLARVRGAKRHLN